MKKVITSIFFLSIIISCNSNNFDGEYHCKRANGKFGSILRFNKGGKLFLDAIRKEIVERNLNLGNKLNIPGEYEIVDDKIIIKYFNGVQSHTLIKNGDKLTSSTDIFRECTCLKNE